MAHRPSPALVVAVGLLAVAALVSGCVSSTTVGEPFPGAGVASGDGLIWTGDAETGDLLQFKVTPQNTAGGADEPEVVSDPAFVRTGSYAVRMTIPASGDGTGICCGARSEIEPNIGQLREDDDLYFGFSTLLGAGFPTDARWQVITQWKNSGDGSPPLELSVENGEYLLSGGAGHPGGTEPFRQAIAPAVAGVWVDWVMRIKFSADPNVGFVEVWHGDDRVLPRFSPPSGTMYPVSDGRPTSYLKVGYYRNPDISQPGTIYFDDWKVGTTRDAVAHPSR